MNHSMYFDEPVRRGEADASAEGLRRGQFTFYASFFEAVDRLPRSRQLETYRAIIDYALNGVLPTLTGGPLVVFTAVQPVLDSARGKAAARLSSTRRSQVGSEEGLGLGLV